MLQLVTRAAAQLLEDIKLAGSLAFHHKSAASGGNADLVVTGKADESVLGWGAVLDEKPPGWDAVGLSLGTDTAGSGGDRVKHGILMISSHVDSNGAAQTGGRVSSSGAARISLNGVRISLSGGGSMARSSRVVPELTSRVVPELPPLARKPNMVAWPSRKAQLEPLEAEVWQLACTHPVSDTNDCAMGASTSPTTNDMPSGLGSTPTKSSPAYSSQTLTASSGKAMSSGCSSPAPAEGGPGAQQSRLRVLHEGGNFPGLQPSLGAPSATTVDAAGGGNLVTIATPAASLPEEDPGPHSESGSTAAPGHRHHSPMRFAALAEATEAEADGGDDDDELRVGSRMKLSDREAHHQLVRMQLQVLSDSGCICPPGTPDG